MNNKGILTRTGLSLVLLLSLSNLCAPSAEALVRDQALYNKLQDQKSSLQEQQRQLEQDYDVLQSHIRDLQNMKGIDQGAVDQLARDADKKSDYLRQVKTTLRDIDNSLI